MKAQLNRLLDIAERAQLASAELGSLLELIQDMEIEREDPDSGAHFIDCRKMMAVMKASTLAAELLNGMNEDLAGGLMKLVKGVEQ